MNKKGYIKPTIKVTEISTNKLSYLSDLLFKDIYDGTEEIFEYSELFK